jgi:hypothetical protein
LSREICSLIARTGFQPASVVEPTCGTGSFLRAALETFPDASRILGFDINPDYVAEARLAVAEVNTQATAIDIHPADFFSTDWPEVVNALPEPILIIGNPPWVTNAALGALEGNNLPSKLNFDRLRGIEALTGKSNFDISEWMIRKNLEWLHQKSSMLAVLCKTTVARKTLFHAWQNRLSIGSASMHMFDARQYFAAAVDACLLLVLSSPGTYNEECRIFSSLQAQHPDGAIGFRDGMLVAEVKLYRKWKHLTGRGLRGWRSGIKHDCSKVFELRAELGRWVNGQGKYVELEPETVFPLLKSADLAAHREPRRWMVVPQQSVSDNSKLLRRNAPKTWEYLQEHIHFLDKRKSSIYKNRPFFSVFGVGPYTFSPWKVAISGLYKKLEFVRVPPFCGRPVVLDDTCYFFPCRSEEECNLLYEMVTSQPAQEFWSAFIFWDTKRPITAQLLNSLDLMTLARELGKEGAIAQVLAERQWIEYAEGAHQRQLF